MITLTTKNVSDCLHVILSLVYTLLMLIMAMLLSRSCPIVDVRNVLIRQRALNDLSAEHEVAGTVVMIEANLYRTCNMS